jgi:hypothetical protein
MNREWALASLAANAAMPGIGSLLVGRGMGYGQLGLALAGAGLTLVYGMRFVVWYFENRSWLEGAEQDPLASLGLVWQHVRMVLLGVAVFGAGWSWSVLGSLVWLWTAWRRETRPPIVDG